MLMTKFFGLKISSWTKCSSEGSFEDDLKRKFDAQFDDS